MGNIKLSEAGSLAGNLINAGRLGNFASVAGEVTVSHVIRVKEKDVGAGDPGLRVDGNECK